MIIKLCIKMNSTFRFSFRKVCYSSVMKSSSDAREARMLRKMIDKGLTRAKFEHKTVKVLKKQNLLTAYENEGISKRMIVLNKTYMEHIPELVHYGNCGSYFSDLNLQISKVQISKDLKYLNIYYVTRNTDVSEHIINDVLRRVVKELQIRIRDLKFSGKVPYVRFINDVRLENEYKLEKFFETIDLGKDSLPTHSKKVFTTNSISKQGDLPVMRQDILGVDVAEIRQRISAGIFRFKAINTVKSDEPSEKPEYPTKLIQFSKKEFFKFYKRRRIEELKRKKKEHQTLYMHDNTNEDEDEYQNEHEVNYEVEYEDEHEDEHEDDFEDEYDDEYDDENEDEYEREYEDDNESETEGRKIN